MTLISQGIYKTSDLALAATLSLQFGVVSMEYEKASKKANFVFPLSHELKETIDAYWQDKLKVEPKLYFNQLKTLKARIYSRG